MYIVGVSCGYQQMLFERRLSPAFLQHAAGPRAYIRVCLSGENARTILPRATMLPRLAAGVSSLPVYDCEDSASTFSQVVDIATMIMASF